MMSEKTRQAAMRRHQEREELMPKVEEMVSQFEKLTKIQLYPPTLRQVALLLRYVRAGHLAYRQLMNGLERSLTFRQAKSVLGPAADPRIENWKSKAGRAVGNLFNELGLR